MSFDFELSSIVVADSGDLFLYNESSCFKNPGFRREGSLPIFMLVGWMNCGSLKSSILGFLLEFDIA